LEDWKHLLVGGLASVCIAAGGLAAAGAAEPLGDWGLEPAIRTAARSPVELGAAEPGSVEPGSAAEQGPGADIPLKARLAALEEKLDRIEREADSIGDVKESISQIADDKTIVHSGTSNSTLKVFGRVHFDAWGFGDADDNIDIFNGDGDVADPNDPQNRLGFRRIRFGVKGDVNVNMLYKIQMEFAGGNDIEMRDVYLGWEELPYLQKVLLGNQKRPYGLDHMNSSRHNVFLERPFVIEAFNQDARRLGLASYGVSDDLRYNWRFGVWNQRNVR
jgi:phosphate-selective porin OprO/OprP